MSLRRTASVELKTSFQPEIDLKHRSLSDSNLNTWLYPINIPIVFIKPKDKSQNLEDFTIVWLDKNIDHIQFDKIRLRELINYCQIFSDSNDCLTYIHTVSLEKIFFIVSGSLGQEIVPIIQDLPQIAFIYVFCADRTKHVDWTKMFSKIQGIFTDEESLITKLTKDVALLSHQLSSINIFSVKKTDYQEKSVKDLNEEQATFMWFQLLIETLILLPNNDKAKHQMIDECRLNYANNKIEERKINDFVDNYTSKSAISWYTRDSFLYRLLNKALRTENIDDIFKYRFFIADLYQQINELYIDFTQKCSDADTNKILTVYRGQSMYATELKKIQDNVDGFISINTFFSTTTSCAIAANFAGDGSGRPLLESVIFEIDLDISKTTKPFANAKSLSVMKNENEIIFSIGTVFRIESVELVTDAIWQIKLIISEKNDEDIKEVYSYLQDDLKTNTPTFQTLSDFLRTMAAYEKAEHYYRLMINELPAQHEDIANNYNGIGLTYYERGLYNEAMEYFQHALIAKSSNYGVVAATYVNIGLLHREKHQYASALQNFQHAVEIMENNSAKPNMVLASIFTNIGNIYDRQGDYRTALVYFNKSRDIARSILPKYHPFFINLYNNIGSVYDNLADYQLALNNYDGALTVSEKILPPNHSSLVSIYVNIGLVCSTLCSYTQALAYYNKALQIEVNSSSPNKHKLVTIYNNIGLAYQNSGKLVEALVNFEKAREFTADSEDLTSIYNNLGTTFMFLKNHEKAIENLQKAVELKQKYLGEKHPSLATTYHNLAALYQTIQDYPNALEYSKKTLAIDQDTLPPNHPNMATTYNNIGIIYLNMSNYSRALEYCERAMEIMEQSNLTDKHPLIVLCQTTLKLIKGKLEKT